MAYSRVGGFNYRRYTFEHISRGAPLPPPACKNTGIEPTFEEFGTAEFSNIHKPENAPIVKT